MPDLDFHHLPGKVPFVGGRAWKKHFHCLIEPRPRARRSRDQKRPLTLGQELRVEQEERQPAEMIAVQMRENDTVNAVEIDTARLERHQRRCSAIDQQRAAGCFEQEAGIESAAGAECITRSDHGQPHRHTFALGRADTAACQRLRFASSSGTASFAGFMKSTETNPVMSATGNVSPATNGRSLSSRSSKAMNWRVRGLLASARAGTCGPSISFIAGWEWRKTWETGKRKCSSSRRFHISMRAISSAPRPNKGGSGLSASK